MNEKTMFLFELSHHQSSLYLWMENASAVYAFDQNLLVSLWLYTNLSVIDVIIWAYYEVRITFSPFTAISVPKFVSVWAQTIGNFGKCLFSGSTFMVCVIFDHLNAKCTLCSVASSLAFEVFS